MAAGYSTRTIAIIAAAAVVAVLAGYWGYGAYQQRQLRNSVGTALKASAERLREAVGVESGSAPQDRVALSKKLEGYAAAVDGSITEVKRLPVERNRALTDDADSYLVTVREIFRKQAGMSLSYHLHTESLRALNDHMRADNRTGAWVSQAVIAKEKAERVFRDYRLAATAYVVLLETFPATEKKVERAIGQELLADPQQLSRARANVLAAVKEAEAEMEKARRFVGPK